MKKIPQKNFVKTDFLSKHQKCVFYYVDPSHGLRKKGNNSIWSSITDNFAKKEFFRISQAACWAHSEIFVLSSPEIGLTNYGQKFNLRTLLGDHDFSILGKKNPFFQASYLCLQIALKCRSRLRPIYEHK